MMMAHPHSLMEGVTPRASKFPSSIKIERTEDAHLIESLLHHPGILDFVSDDGELTVPLHPLIYYFIPTIEVSQDGSFENRPIGCMAFMPINFIAWNPHLAILPQYRGRGTEVMQLGIDWMFGNTRCQKIVANVPEYHVAMRRVFEKCGLQKEGYSPKSVMKRGVLHGRILMGANK